MALRILVSISAIGSVIAISCASYQLAFVTPGISPFRAISLKQIRQRPNFLKYPSGRPQLKQRLYPRVLNFGFLFAFTISDFLAIKLPQQFLLASWVFPAREGPLILTANMILHLF